jgi:hypothetical protein
MADSDVEMGSAADIGNRRLRMDQELATATRGRVQLVINNGLRISIELIHTPVSYCSTCEPNSLRVVTARI